MRNALSKEKFDIIVLAGQSNASGFGVGPVSEEYVPDRRILLMENDAIPYYTEPEEGSPYKYIMKFMNPTPRNTVRIADEVLADRGKVSSLAITFAEQYARTFLDSERKVLIIDSACGGTGFTCPAWGVGNPLHNRMMDMVSLALSCNPENRIVAFLWHQGEHDAVENEGCASENTYRTHKANLLSMLNDFYTKFDCKSAPFITAGFCNEWYQSNRVVSEPIIRAIREVAAEVGGRYIDVLDLQSNNQATENGDVIHFSRESQHVLGRRLFEQYTDIIQNK